jgi:hypothetical protein
MGKEIILLMGLLLAPMIPALYEDCQIYGTCPPTQIFNTYINETVNGSGGGNFSGNYVDLDFTGTTGLSDNVDNDTTYTHLSNFTNDPGYITGYTENDPYWSANESLVCFVGDDETITGTWTFNNAIKALSWSNVSITESQITDLTHTTDTNETTRFDTLVGTDCSLGQFATGHNNAGLIQCDSPGIPPEQFLWETFRDDHGGSATASSSTDIFDFIDGNGIDARISGTELQINMTGNYTGDFDLINGNLSREVTNLQPTRALDVNYVNNFGTPLFVYGNIESSAADWASNDYAYVDVYACGTRVQQVGIRKMTALYFGTTTTGVNASFGFSFVVPEDCTYSINESSVGSADAVLIEWTEVSH